MDQDYVLRVLGQQRRFDVKRMQASLLAHFTMTLPVIFG
jgi:hypothetical protein